MPREGSLPLLCDALIRDDWADGGRVRCGCELRFLGPTVAEWRAANDAITEAKHNGRRDVETLQRMLQSSDEALAECSRQIEEQRAQLDSAEREVEHLRMIVGITGASAGWVPRSEADEYLRERDEARELHRACQEEYRSLDDARQEALRSAEDAWAAHEAVAAERDAAMQLAERRGATAQAIRERDLYRTRAADYWARLDAVRAALRAEAARLDTKRPNFANRLRASVAETWTLAEQIKQEEALADELAEPVGSARIGADPSGPGSIAEVEWTHASGTRLLNFLGCPPGEWQNALSELRTVIPLPAKTGPELITAAVELLREARVVSRERDRAIEDAARGRSDFETLRQRCVRAERKVGELRSRSQGFTIVRDVNQQTERELERVRRDYREQRDQRRGLACQLAHWQSIALWVAEQLNIDPPLGGTVDLEERYDAAMEADSR